MVVATRKSLSNAILLWRKPLVCFRFVNFCVCLKCFPAFNAQRITHYSWALCCNISFTISVYIYTIVIISLLKFVVTTNRSEAENSFRNIIATYYVGVCVGVGTWNVIQKRNNISIHIFFPLLSFIMWPHFKFSSLSAIDWTVDGLLFTLLWPSFVFELFFSMRLLSISETSFFIRWCNVSSNRILSSSTWILFHIR